MHIIHAFVGTLALQRNELHRIDRSKTCRKGQIRMDWPRKKQETKGGLNTWIQENQSVVNLLLGAGGLVATASATIYSAGQFNADLKADISKLDGKITALQNEITQINKKLDRKIDKDEPAFFDVIAYDEKRNVIGLIHYDKKL